MTKRRHAIGSWLPACLLFLMGAPVLALDSVTLQLKWLHAFQFAGYYTAIAQGYYRDAGLEVRIREAVPGEDPMQHVLDGTAEFGVGDSGILLRRYKGDPFVVLGVVFQHSALALVALKQSPTQSIHNLAGKTLMLMQNDAELYAYLGRVGLSPDKYRVVPTSFDINDLISGKTDASSAYITDQIYALDTARIPYVAYSPRSEGIDFYGDNLYTTERQLKDHPERVKAFREASFRGWKYAMDHKEETVSLILDNYSTRHDRNALTYEADRMDPLIQPVLVEMGYMNPGRWRHIAGTYADIGMLPHGFPLTEMLYDPNPVRDLTWLYPGLAATLAAIAVFGFIALKFFRFLQARLREKKFLDAIVANEPECVKLLTKDGELLQMNHAGLRMLEVDSLKEIHEVGVMNFIHPDHRSKFKSFHDSVCAGSPGRLIFRVLGRKGTPRWVETHATPLIDRQYGTLHLAVARDITEQKKSEVELARVNSELIEISRRAGMSEIATEVLHNVGNVLNGLNVSASIIADKISESKSRGLSLVVDLLAEHEGDLERFLTSDPKGRRVPAFLAALNADVSAERQEIQVELNALQNRIDHIKEVVARQQGHAKGPRVLEEVNLNDLIEESLALLQQQLEAHGIQVARAFSDVGPVSVEKHKVIQILVNLIKNAVQACIQSNRAGKQVVVGLETGDATVTITVSDNGVGIPEENLLRIFNFGFSTKRDGHGFGLHSSANFAKEMGGRLIAHSSGQGARFSLELPRRPLGEDSAHGHGPFEQPSE